MKKTGSNTNHRTKPESKYHISYLGNCTESKKSLVIMLYQCHHNGTDYRYHSDCQQKQSDSITRDEYIHGHPCKEINSKEFVE